jgi:hypothetical protein
MALVKNPLFARWFDRYGARNEERGNRELRREMLTGLSGRVIEVGAGNGLNFPHYPASVQGKQDRTRDNTRRGARPPGLRCCYGGKTAPRAGRRRTRAGHGHAACHGRARIGR